MTMSGFCILICKMVIILLALHMRIQMGYCYMKNLLKIWSLVYLKDISLLYISGTEPFIFLQQGCDRHGSCAFKETLWGVCTAGAAESCLTQGRHHCDSAGWEYKVSAVLASALTGNAHCTAPRQIGQGFVGSACQSNFSLCPIMLSPPFLHELSLSKYLVPWPPSRSMLLESTTCDKYNLLRYYYVCCSFWMFPFFIPRTCPDLALGPFAFFEDNPPFWPRSLMEICLSFKGLDGEMSWEGSSQPWVNGITLN